MSVLCARLCSVLNPGVEELDHPLAGGEVGEGGFMVEASPWKAGTSDKIRFLFGEFTSELLQVRGGGGGVLVMLTKRWRRSPSNSEKDVDGSRSLSRSRL